MKKLSKQQNFQLARDLAFKELKEMDIASISGRAGWKYYEEDAGTAAILIDYLGKPVRVAPSAGTFDCDPDDWTELGGQVKPREEIFILHYLLGATGKLPTGNLIPFRSLDGGMAYDSVFQGRTVSRLFRAFSNREERLTDICGLLGGTPGDLGNVSVRLRVLPHIELVIVLWKGDDELPTSGNILFDESVTDYLSTEDCVVLAEAVVSRIIYILSCYPVKNSNRS